VARHSAARNVWISLDWADGQLTFRIRDDGKGLSRQTARDKKTLGILGMKERALMMGGNLDIRNEDEGGLTLEVIVPVKKATAQ